MSDAGCLYIVATPIGNLEDISQRALYHLTHAGYIVAEHPKHSSKLLSAYDIEGKKVLTYQDKDEQRMSEKIITLMQQGEDVVLISDAGTPLISDPGYRLVSRAHEQGMRVIPIPGACALIAALSASGLSGVGFYFHGFLPDRSAARVTQLTQLDQMGVNFIFYESPYRLQSCLNDLSTVVGLDRPVCLAKELTKAYESLVFAPLEEHVSRLDGERIRGEWVVLVQGAQQEVEEYPVEFATELNDLLGAKRASHLISKYFSVKKNTVYQRLIHDK